MLYQGHEPSKELKNKPSKSCDAKKSVVKHFQNIMQPLNTIQYSSSRLRIYKVLYHGELGNQQDIWAVATSTVLGAEFLFLFSSRFRSLALKSSSNDTFFFVQKEVLGEKIFIWVKYGNIFKQIRGRSQNIDIFYDINVDKKWTFLDHLTREKRNRKFRALMVLH